MSKRILAMLLVVMLLVGMLPTNLFAFTASAEEGSEPASVSMEALRTETAITVDGAFSETAWSSWTKIPASAEGAPSGGVAAAWDLEKLYLAINADADTAALTVNGTALTVNLSEGTVTGVDGAVSAGSNGVVEIAIPLASLDITLSVYGQSVAISGSLSKGGVTSTLAADKLILSGKVASVVDFSAATGAGAYSVEGNSATINTSAFAYFLYLSGDILVDEEFLMSYDLKLTEIPVCTPTYNGNEYNGFCHYFLSPYDDPNSHNAKVKSVVYAIYRPTADSGLMLVARGDNNTQDYTFTLNRNLNENFRLTWMVHADGSADLFVDGVYVGTVNGAVHLKSGYGQQFSYWQYNPQTGDPFTSTIGDVRAVQNKYTGNVPLATGNLEALVAEDAVNVDGTLSELVWSRWAKILVSAEDAPSGAVAAAWDFEKLYLAINADANIAALTVNGTALIVNLSEGTVTGVDGAVSAGSNGVVEIAIPLASLDITLSDYGQSVDISGILWRGRVKSLLAADKLILSGKVASVVDFSAAMGTDGAYTVEGNSATINTSAFAYFLYLSGDILVDEEFLMSYDLKLTEIPVCTPTYNGNEYNGFCHYFLSPYEDPNVSPAYVKSVVYAIYRPTADSGLMLVARGDNNTQDYTFALNRNLGENFRLTWMVHADGSADLLVDGVYVGTVNGAVHLKTGYGKEFSYWQYNPQTGDPFTCTISDVRTLQTKYTSTITPPKLTMEALLTETDVTVDGKLLEIAWSNWSKFLASAENAPSGDVAASWNRDNIYLAFTTENATTAQVTIGDKVLTVNLSDGTVTGVQNTQGAVVNGAVEVAIPWTELGIQNSPYEMALPMSMKLVGQNGTSALPATKLNITGMVMNHIDICKEGTGLPEGSFKLEGKEVTMEASQNGQYHFWAYTSATISMNGELLLTYNMEFTELPVGTPSYNGHAYNGFYHYVVGAYENAMNEAKRVIYAIYRPSEDSGLMLMVRGDNDTGNYTFDLNRDLNEEFKLTWLTHPNGSADLFVDGDYLGTVKGAVHLKRDYGKTSSVWYYEDSNAAVGTMKCTISQFGMAEQKYPVLNNMLTIQYVLGQVPNSVTRNMDLPVVLPYSDKLGDIPITWHSSDETVLKPDGTVIRDPDESKKVTLTLLYNGEEKDSVEVTVLSQKVQEHPGTDILTVGFAGTPVVMDGSIAEDSWPMHGRVVDTQNYLVAEFGAQWDTDYLYLAVDTVTEGVPFVVTLNGNAFHVSGGNLLDSSDAEVTGSTVAQKNSIVEIKIPVAALGLTDSDGDPITRIAEYDYKVPISLKVKEVSYEGTLHLSRVDWFAAENRENTLPLRDGYIDTIQEGGGAPDGNQGVDKVENGYRLYDLYNENGTNPSAVASYVILMNEPIYADFADRTVAGQVNFDFVANALPVYDLETGIDETQKYSNYGFSIWWCDHWDADYWGNVVFAGIMRMEDGLYFVMSDQPVQTVKLNKQIGESFHVGLTWETNGDVVLSIDGEEIHTFVKASRRAKQWGDSGIVWNLKRNTNQPTSSADDIDVTVTNFSFGKNYNQENLLQALTFSDICGENTSEDNITQDLGTLPTTITGYGPLQDSFDITWTSSHPEIISETGKVTLPASGVQQVTLTASTVDGFGRTHSKKFLMLVSSGVYDNSNVMYVYNDRTPATTPGVEGYTDQLFTLDASNNSIVAVLDNVQQINTVVLKDIDDVARLNAQALTLWVSDDNVTYTRVKNFKLLHVENKWYLYDFNASAKYVKVHYTHYYTEDASFISTFEDMITAEYHEVFGGKNAQFTTSTYTLTNSTGKTQRDYPFPIAKSALGITGTDASIRLYLNGELLYHYVDGDTVYVRIRDLAAGASATLTVKQSDDETVMDIANKEAVYEVIYGTIETLDNSTTEIGRWVTVLPTGMKFPNGDVLEQDTILSMNRYGVRASTDGGRTWFKWADLVDNAPEGKTPVYEGFWGDGGWIINEKTGRLLYAMQDGTTYKYVYNNMAACSLVSRILASDDGGKTWYIIDMCEPDPNDVHSLYLHGYINGTMLRDNDGAGPNVDLVLPLAAMYNDHDALCGRVIYSRDGGETWERSESIIINGFEAGYEGGISEGSILEREDGVLVMYLRSQSVSNVRFAVSYSLDKGVTWQAMSTPSTVFSTGTQPLLLQYDFGETEAPILMWGGNNATGAVSHVRNPASFAVSTNDMETFRNIQNLYSKTFLEHYGSEWTHIFSNPTGGQINGDGMFIAFTPGSSATAANIIVDNFTDWFTRTKGLYDSFEHGTTQYEGWVTVGGSTAVTGDQKVTGKYSMQVDNGSVVTRSVPYLQNGSVEMSIYVGENSNFTIQLQSAYAKIYNGQGMPIGLRVENNKLYLNNETTPVATLNANAWNTFAFDLEMTEDKASVAVNGGEAIAIPVITENGDYVCSLTIMTSGGQDPIYVDEVLVQSELDAVIEMTDADRAAAEAVIAQIKAIGEVTADDAEAITAARSAYNALTQVQRDWVDRNVPSGTTTDPNDEDAMINYYDILVAAENSVEEEPVVKSRSISLTGNIALNYFMSIPETVVEDETAHMLFTLPDGSTQKVFVKDAALMDDGRYRFSCAVAAREMTGTIKAQFIYAGGSTAVYDYSIRDYADEENLPDNEKLQRLLDAMLRYGGSAQRYFGTNTGDLADANNRWSQAELDAITADTLEAYKVVATNTEAAKITSVSLFLRSETTLRVYFTVADGTAFTVLDGTKELTAVKDGNRYYVDIENIAAQHLDEVHNITVKGNNGAVLTTAKVSALSYCYAVLTAQNTTAGNAISAELIEQVKALYLYNQAANAYFD